MSCIKYDWAYRTARKLLLTNCGAFGLLMFSYWFGLAAIAADINIAATPTGAGSVTQSSKEAPDNISNKKTFIIKAVAPKALRTLSDSAKLAIRAKQGGQNGLKPSAARLLAGTNAAVAVCGVAAGGTDVSCTVTGNLVCEPRMSGESAFGCSFESGLIETSCDLVITGPGATSSVTCFGYGNTDAEVNCTDVPAANGITGETDSRCEFDTLVNVTVSPSALDFMLVPSGAVRQLPLTINNDGSLPVTLVSSVASAAEFGTGSPACGTTLAAGASCVEQVRFSPTSAGGKNETYTLKFASTTGLAKNFIVPLSATVIASGAPFIVSRTGGLSFFATTDGKGNTSRPLIYENVGDGLFTGGLTVSSGFAITQNECVTSLSAGRQCTVSIMPSGKTGGALRGIAEIKGTDGRVWARIPLTGFTRVEEDCE